MNFTSTKIALSIATLSAALLASGGGVCGQQPGPANRGDGNAHVHAERRRLQRP